MKFHEIIEKLKENKGLKTGRDVQNYLGFKSESGYYFMLNGKGALKDETIAKLIEGTGLPAPLIIGAWEAEHSKSEIVRKSWENWLKAVAVMAILGAVVPYTTTLEKGGIAQCLFSKVSL